MNQESAANRALIQEVYLQDLALTIYGIYLSRLNDTAGCAILETYLRGERFRATQIETYLGRVGLHAAPAVRTLFRGIGQVYGHLTSLLGTRMMLRIILSASRRASRRACVVLGDTESADLLYLTTLRARNEGDLLADLRQHMIDTGRPIAPK
jgi:hypothetical protein